MVSDEVSTQAEDDLSKLVNDFCKSVNEFCECVSEFLDQIPSKRARVYKKESVQALTMQEADRQDVNKHEKDNKYIGEKSM